MKLIILVGLCFGFCIVAGDRWLGDGGFLGLSSNGYDNENQGDNDYKRQGKEVKNKDDFLEYIGYSDGFCDGRKMGDNDGFNRNNYGSQIYRDRTRSNRNYYNYYDEDMKERCDQLYGFTGPTANDEPENIMRPCALDDWQCIRKFFAANSKCKPVSGPIPDPLYFDINTVFYPVANITVTIPNLMIRGLGTAKIQEFYVNKKSGNLVFAIVLTKLNETISRIYFRYRRTAKESIVLADYATVEYSDVTFTAIIPKMPHLQLHLADIHPYVGSAIPPFFIGPGAFNSTDPAVISSFAIFNLNIPIVVREGLVFQAPLLTSIYIQKNICDFGLQITNI